VLNARNPERLTALADDITANGGSAYTISESVDTLAGAERIMAAAVDYCGRIDVLVNSAGLPRTQPLLELTEEEWNKVISTELTGIFTCCRAAAEQMIAQGSGGQIIIIAGGAGIYGLPGDSAHAAAKGGVGSAFVSWAEELRGHNITVNAVRGGVRSQYTDVHVASFDHATRERRSAKEYGFFEPEEAAPLVVWLASEAAQDVTGRYIGIDGPRISFWQPGPPEPSVFHFPSWSVDEIEAAVRPVLSGLRPAMKGEHLLLTGVDLDPWLKRWSPQMSSPTKNPDNT
jgi:NAD(P)-dependent dehydrogenase (short-subunit alcohol dehydrogenase family)